MKETIILLLILSTIIVVGCSTNNTQNQEINNTTETNETDMFCNLEYWTENCHTKAVDNCDESKCLLYGQNYLEGYCNQSFNKQNLTNNFNTWCK